MRAEMLYLAGKEKLEIKTVNLADPADGEVQVQIKACGDCTGDIVIFGTCPAPRTFGHEGVGVVVRTGPGIGFLKPGDKVFCLHGASQMGQYANVPVQSAVRIPHDTEDYAQWVGEPVACVVNAIDQLHITPGARAAIVGMGFMGLLNLQGMAHTLAGEIHVFDIMPERLALAKCFGADARHQTNKKDFGEKAEELSGGFDIVVDATGSADGFALACRLTKTAGTLSLFGCHRGLRHFDGDDWHTKGLKVLNTAPSCDPHYFTRGPQAAVLMKKGVFDLQRLVTHVCSYHGAQALFETALYKNDGYIKGVVTF